MKSRWRRAISGRQAAPWMQRTCLVKLQAWVQPHLHPAPLQVLAFPDLLALSAFINGGQNLLVPCRGSPPREAGCFPGIGASLQSHKAGWGVCPSLRFIWQRQGGLVFESYTVPEQRPQKL